MQEQTDKSDIHSRGRPSEPLTDRASLQKNTFQGFAPHQTFRPQKLPLGPTMYLHAKTRELSVMQLIEVEARSVGLREESLVTSD